MALSEPELIQIRRKLHQIPEIGMEEFETQKELLKIIQAMPRGQNLENSNHGPCFRDRWKQDDWLSD